MDIQEVIFLIVTSFLISSTTPDWKRSDHGLPIKFRYCRKTFQWHGSKALGSGCQGPHLSEKMHDAHWFLVHPGTARTGSYCKRFVHYPSPNSQTLLLETPLTLTDQMTLQGFRFGTDNSWRGHCLSDLMKRHRSACLGSHCICQISFLN